MYYLVGRIINTHGIKGELKIINESDFDRFKVGNTLFILKDNKYEEVKISSVRYHQNFVLITINGLNNINDVYLIAFAIIDPTRDRRHVVVVLSIALSASQKVCNVNEITLGIRKITINNCHHTIPLNIS